MWAVLPAKNFTDAKQRLGGVLNAEERTALFAAMFEDVLSTLVRVPGLDGVLVVTLPPLPSPLHTVLRFWKNRKTGARQPPCRLPRTG